MRTFEGENSLPKVFFVLSAHFCDCKYKVLSRFRQKKLAKVVRPPGFLTHLLSYLPKFEVLRSRKSLDNLVGLSVRRINPILVKTIDMQRQLKFCDVERPIIVNQTRPLVKRGKLVTTPGYIIVWLRPVSKVLLVTLIDLKKRLFFVQQRKNLYLRNSFCLT